MLDGLSSTQERYSVLTQRGFRVYVDEGRDVLHHRLLSEALAEGRATDAPAATVVAGGPASGKSTLIRAMGVPPGFVLVDPDRFKEQLPEYQGLANGEYSDWAALVVHEESSDLVRELFSQCIEARSSLVLDTTGDGPPGAFVTKLEPLKAANYAVRVLYADAGLEVARERNRARSRYVPDEVLTDLHAAVAAGFQEVLAEDWLNEVSVYDTEPAGEPVLIAQKLKGQSLDVLNDTRLKAFTDKAAI